ncbi:TPA: phage tail fiber protein [Enterobacter cloacae]
MTVSSEQSFIEYNGDGATQNFVIPFYFILNSDISITVADADGNLDDLTYGVDFSASGAGNPDGGTATLNNAYASGYTILIYRNPPETQETAYYENGKFPAKSHEKALDKLTMLIQKYGWWFDSLALKKPSYLAQYYDAEGNRISNLANPINSQDASTKSYVDGLNNKTLRFSNDNVMPLPSLEQMEGKVVAIAGGRPVGVLPGTGTATDVLIELAKPTGTNLIGYGSDILTNSVSRTLKSFGAVGDGSTLDNAAVILADSWSISTGKPVIVTNGQYKLLNVQLGGKYLFDKDAWFVNEALGATDNIVIAKAGLKFRGWNTRVGCVAWPTSGNYGNALLIGSYYQPADDSGLVNDIEIYDFTIVGTTTAFSGQAMEGLGNIDGVKVKRGKCIGQGTGMLFHWGGDVDLSNPHTSTVTYSHHPRNIEVEDVQFLSSDGVTPRAIGLYFSACYNVKANNIYGERCPALISAKPGDVYDQVAVARDKGKVHTGIDIDNCYSRLPPDTSSAMIAITGVPDTYRTSSTRLSALDPASPSEITVNNVTVDLGTAAYTNPMILVRGAKNVKGSFNVVGGKSTVTPWALIDYTVKSNIRFSGSCPGGVRSRGFGSSISEHAQHCDESVSYSSAMVGFNPQSFTQSGITLQAAVSVGNTSVSVQASADSIIFYGAMLYSGTVYIGKVTRTTWLAAGVTNTVPVTKSANAVSSGSAITSYLTSEGLKVTGTISGFMYNIQSTNTWGIDFSVNIERGYRGGILCDGTYCRSAKFSGSYDGVGWEDGAAVNANIQVTATTVRNVIINGCRFDADETNPTIDNHVLVSTTDHAGVIISENTGTNPSAVAFSISNSTVAEAYSMQQIYGNHINGLQAPVATATGMYVGGYFRGVVRNNAVPTTGYWNVGDKVDRATITASGQEGWACTVAGTSGTWVGYGTIAAS